MGTPGFFNRAVLLENMHERGLEALLVTSPGGIAYTTGVDLYTQFLIPERLVLNLITANGDATVITFARERSLFEAQSWVKDVRSFSEFGESGFALLASVLSEKGLARGRIGLERMAFPIAFYEQLQRLAPGVTLMDGDEVLSSARRIKTEAEIEFLYKVARAMDKAIDSAAAVTETGDRESLFATRIVSNLLAAFDGNVGAIDPLVASGPNLALAHNTYSKRVIEEEDLVRYGCKARFSGYWCLLLRTRQAGVITPSRADGYARYAEAFFDSIRHLRPGVRAGDAYDRCKREVEKRGLTLISEKIGHSTGVVFRDIPVLRPGDDRLLEANMVLAHDFLAVDASGGHYFIEDRVLITDQGARLMSDVSDTRYLKLLGT